MRRGLPWTLLLVLALAAGCQQKTESTTTTYTETPAPAGEFPGTLPANYLSAIDGMAFSPPAESVSSLDDTRVRYFPSGVGYGILLFQTRDGAGNYHLYAAHVDTVAAMTPAVELFCANQDPAQAADLHGARVLFLRSVGEREADALVVVPRTDLDDPLGTDPASDPNVRLYYGYFDFSVRGDPVNGSRRYGFDTDLSAIDSSDTEDVHLTGLLTFGTAGACRYPAGAPHTCRQGQPTVFTLLLWSQRTAAGAPERLYYRRFDAETGTLGNATAVPLDSAAAATDDVVHAGAATEMDAYDNVLFFNRTDTATGDELLLAAVYDADSQAFATNAYLLSPRLTSNLHTVLPPGQAGPGRLFGPDEGLTTVVGFFQVTGYNLATETSLYAFQIDHDVYDGTGYDATPGQDLIEVDAGGGTSVAWSVDGGSADWRSSRTGNWILLAYLQARSETDATAALWVRALRTVAAGGDPAPLSEHLSAPLRLDADAGTLPVDGFQLPADLAWREAQSSLYTVTAVWKQDAGAGADTLRHNTVTADLSPEPPAPPTVAAGATEGTVAFPDGELGLADVTVLDGGGAGGTAGAAYVYYIRNAQTGSYGSYRAFQFSTATSVETNVGSLTGDTAATYQPREAVAIRVLSTSRNIDSGGEPEFAGRVHHIFLREYRHGDSQGSLAWRHRAFVMDDEAALPADRFRPPADGSADAAAPVCIDGGVSHDSTLLFTGRVGDAVCAYFSQANAVLYNEWDAGSATWRTTATLVSNEEAGEDLPAGAAVFGADYLDYPGSYYRSVVLWGRTLDGGSVRLFVRIRY